MFADLNAYCQYEYCAKSKNELHYRLIHMRHTSHFKGSHHARVRCSYFHILITFIANLFFYFFNTMNIWCCYCCCCLSPPLNKIVIKLLIVNFSLFFLYLCICVYILSSFVKFVFQEDLEFILPLRIWFVLYLLHSRPAQFLCTHSYYLVFVCSSHSFNAPYLLFFSAFIV